MTHRRDAAQAESNLLAYWENKFPGQGSTILGVLRPIYQWNARLQPPVVDLRDRVQYVLDVRAIPYTLDQADSIAAIYAQQSDGENFSHMAIRLTKKYGAYSLDETQLADPRLDMFLRSKLIRALGEECWDSLYFSFWDTIWMVCKLALAGETQNAEELKSFLGLWLDGNFPDFFTPEGDLLVLVGA